MKDVSNFLKDVHNFREGCNKGSKVSSEVGIDPKSLPNGFQNEIMGHLCSDGGPRSNRIGCTKGSKLHSEVGINPQSLPYELINEIMDHLCSNGDPENNKIGCTKFNERYTKFFEGCTKGSKVRSKVGIDPK